MAVYSWIAILVAMYFTYCSGFRENGTSIDQNSKLVTGRQTCSDKDRNIQCPYCRNGTCQRYTAPCGIVSCNNNDDLTVLDCYCATYKPEEKSVQVGACIFNCQSKHNITLKVCASFSRTGELCGRCLDKHYVSAYSFDSECKCCDNVVRNWFRYIMAAYLPLTLFYFIVLFFKVNVASGYLHPAVLFGQTISLPPLARILLQSVQNNSHIFFIKVSGAFYGIWSLDFFRPFYTDLCLGLGILPTLALDYVIAVYPLVLMIISYLLIVLYDRNYRVVTIMWRPFRFLFSLFRRNWDIRTSVIDAYATFFLLSYMKFLNVSFDLLAPTQVYHLNTYNYTHTWALYYAGDVEYFGKEHLPYGILAIAVLCVFVILPTVTLALYPFAFFQKFLNLFPFRWHILHMFMDSFQGCYKNGTEPGTRDYRWFSAAYLVLRWVFFILYGLTLNPAFYPLWSLSAIFFIILLVIFRPYKASHQCYSKINIVFLAIFAGFCVAVFGFKSHVYSQFFYVFSLLLGLVPLLFIIMLILHGIFSRWKFFFELVYRIRSWCQRHKALGHSAETVDSDRVVNPQEYPAIPMRRYNSLVDLFSEESTEVPTY